MTEAMSRREIEDVLTSIKRLVSHEVQSRVTPVQPATEKLVLTPSLRVREGTSADDGASGTAPASTAPTSKEREQQPQSKAETDIGTSAGLASNVPDPELNTERNTENASDVPENTRSLLRRISQAGLTQPAAAPARTDQVNAPPHAAPLAADTAEASDEQSDILVPPSEDAELEATLARLESVLSAGKTPPAPPSAAALPPSDPAGTTTDIAPGEQIIDEGMLYQLVAHIVRQELQGELGEKITRNIRKLVRAEVARELQLRRP